MCLLQEATNLEDLQTAQVTGMASELTFQSMATGNYIVTVLPHPQDHRQMLMVAGSSAVHIQHINITIEDTVSVPVDTTPTPKLMVLGM